MLYLRTVHLALARERAEHCSQPAAQGSLKNATTAYASGSRALCPLPLATMMERHSILWARPVQYCRDIFCLVLALSGGASEESIHECG